MATIAPPTSALGGLLIIRDQYPRKTPKMFAFPVMKNESARSSNAEEEDISGDLLSVAIFPLLEVSSTRTFPAPRDPRMAASSRRSSLYFKCNMSSEDKFDCEHGRVFGCFIAREALHDEEFLMATLLRMESLWEDSLARHLEASKLQFAKKEFNALKRRCKMQQPQKCICIVAKKKDEDANKNALVLGTLDLNIRPHLRIQPLPELAKSPFFSDTYGADKTRIAHITNLCVFEHARRQGIAKNMLLVAIEAATSYGCKKVVARVDVDNIAALKLFDQVGFQLDEAAIPLLLVNGQTSLWLKI